MAKAIDQQYIGKEKKLTITDPEYGKGERRYVNTKNRHVFVAFLAEWKYLFCDRIQILLKEEEQKKITDPNYSNALLDIPFRYSLFEVGWGADVAERANAHDEHDKSNYLWKFYLAVAKYLFDPDEKLFEIKRWQCNHLAVDSNELHLAQLNDNLHTMMARSEWHNGGFNPQPGGGPGVSEGKLKRSKPWMMINFNKYYSGHPHGLVQVNLQADKAKISRLQELEAKFSPQWTLDIEREIKELKEANKKEELIIEERLQVLKDVELVLEMQDVQRRYEEALALEISEEAVDESDVLMESIEE